MFRLSVVSLSLSLSHLLKFRSLRKIKKELYVFNQVLWSFILLFLIWLPNTHTHTHTYIYIVLFGPVKPDLGVIPRGQENHSGAEHLNFPGRELNVIFYRAILKIKNGNAIKRGGNSFISSPSPSILRVYSVLFIHWIWKSPVIFFFVFLVHTRNWKTGWK